MTEEVTCRHHWLIETLLGSHSPGKCKFCGETKMFPNSIESQDIELKFNPFDPAIQSPAKRKRGYQENRKRLSLRR